jgi:hypothetical protein
MEERRWVPRCCAPAVLVLYLPRKQPLGGDGRRALALNPKLPGIQLNLGRAEFKQGRF